MNLKKEDVKKVGQALAAAYQTGEDMEVGHAWEHRVMGRVRAMGPLTSRNGFADLFDRYFWRFAPVAALMLLVLGSVLYYQMDFLSEYEMARIFVQNRLDDSLFQVLGIS